MVAVLSGPELVDLADSLAERYHAGQVDKSGRPYIEHPRAVAARFYGESTLEAAALLHDVLEDTEATADDLRAEGIPDDVIRLVEILTRDKAGGETYAAFIERVCTSRDAARIKLRDVLHNIDPTRMYVLPPNLAVRYHKALVRITGYLTGDL